MLPIFGPQPNELTQNSARVGPTHQALLILDILPLKKHFKKGINKYPSKNYDEQ
jgi:hypothetical protein